MGKKRKSKAKKSGDSYQNSRVRDLRGISVLGERASAHSTHPDAAAKDSTTLTILKQYLGPADFQLLQEGGVFHDIELNSTISPDDAIHEALELALDLDLDLDLDIDDTSDTNDDSPLPQNPLVHTRPDLSGVSAELLGHELVYIRAVLEPAEMRHFLSNLYYDTVTGGSINYLDLSDHLEASFAPSIVHDVLNQAEGTQLAWSTPSLLLAYEGLKRTEFYMRLLLVRAHLDALAKIIEALKATPKDGTSVPRRAVVPQAWITKWEEHLQKVLRAQNGSISLQTFLTGPVDYPFYPHSFIESTDDLAS